MFKKSIFLVLTALSLIGCTQVVKVSKSVEGEVQNNKLPSVKVDGIPFYVKKKVYNKTSVFAQTWLDVTLKIEKEEIIDKNGSEEYKPLPPISFPKNLKKENFFKIVALKKKILKKRIYVNKQYVDKLEKEFKNIDGIADFSDIKTELIGKTMESKWVVDEKEKYYLNAPIPLFGKGELTQTLNSDGTLNSATVKVDETAIASSIASLIPFSDYLTAKYVTEPEMKERTQRKKAKRYRYKLTLNTKEKGYIYKITKQYEHNSKDKRYPTFKDHKKDTCTYTREEIGKGSDNASNNNVAPKGKSVTLTGKINLPE